MKTKINLWTAKRRHRDVIVEFEVRPSPSENLYRATSARAVIGGMTMSEEEIYEHNNPDMVDSAISMSLDEAHRIKEQSLGLAPKTRKKSPKQETPSFL